jgi:hypothetical protein
VLIAAEHVRRSSLLPDQLSIDQEVDFADAASVRGYSDPPDTERQQRPTIERRPHPRLRALREQAGRTATARHTARNQ